MKSAFFSPEEKKSGYIIYITKALFTLRASSW